MLWYICPHSGLIGRWKGALQLSAAAIVLKWCAWSCRSEDCALHFDNNEPVPVCREHRFVMVTHIASVWP